MLSQLLGIPYVSLDSLFWRLDWEQTPDAEFQALVSQTMNDNSKGCIIDGNYQRHIGRHEMRDTMAGAPANTQTLLIYHPLVRVDDSTFHIQTSLEQSKWM
ncbi:uncharacterized protein BT62DRAFT_936977 [Guyanagaster necrorhizus]|uniref:Uncharacterized protein n=1 Tax=Guyanagaster necrorhizus TaxID=856835 RepID=A0A9P7VIX3_9AGAR|nr:uncharacterized protein BT62DRAFT_936977 [Guyanagaster necrorhizus MCA 3950]KAG7441452.1 hypothetical protein BT62DRAFT_936977 [Guyanagaster necrorhizus MCA 3950]